MSRILIIEPNADFRNVLADVLGDCHGLETRCCGSCADVDVTFGPWSPTIAFVATGLLRELDGGVHTLRSSLPTLRFVVGMCTDRFNPTADLGCDRIVAKPFDAEKLLGEVVQLLGGGTRG